MRKWMATYLVVAIVLLGTVSAIGNTIDLNAIAKLTRAKQIAKQEKVDFVAKTLASKPVHEALQKAGVSLKENEIKDLAKFAPPQNLDLLYTQCVLIDKSMALGQTIDDTYIWLLVLVMIVVIVYLVNRHVI